jgi:hypothetical protein
MFPPCHWPLVEQHELFCCPDSVTVFRIVYNADMLQLRLVATLVWTPVGLSLYSHLVFEIDDVQDPDEFSSMKRPSVHWTDLHLKGFDYLQVTVERCGCSSQVALTP